VGAVATFERLRDLEPFSSTWMATLASSVFALVVTGPPGAGKTTVLTALQNGLVDDGIGHAAIEIEALSWAHPPLSDSEAFVHLAAIRGLYASRGYDLILCGATITTPEYMEDLLAVLAADRSLVIRLDAEPEVLRQRIIEREPRLGQALLISSTPRRRSQQPAACFRT
jgi:ribose 1,5-bisphosphokinase PhnN